MSRFSSFCRAASAASALGLLLTACEPASTADPASSSTSIESTTTTTIETTTSAAETTAAQALDEASTAALATLATIPVKGRAPKTGYSREMFGQRWSDDVDVELGHNGCDTRNDILGRDLTQTAMKAGTRDCVVLSGVLNDPYTGKTIDFVRGNGTSNLVQIDHIVALSDAWQKGAQQLTAAERQNFANDPRNLQAIDGPTNQKKGDSDAATWLPPNRSYRCTYVARQIEVKAAYRLWVTQAEHDAMARLLTGCGGTAPVAASSTTSSSASVTSETSTSTPMPRTTTQAPAATRPQGLMESPAPGGSAYYPNCAAARAAGAAPIYRGQPGYSSKLDRDGDGIACE